MNEKIKKMTINISCQCGLVAFAVSTYNCKLFGSWVSLAVLIVITPLLIILGIDQIKSMIEYIND